jgi:protein phosphatase 2C
MAAAAICGEDERPNARRGPGSRGWISALVAGGKRSVYLMECEPVWGCVATPGRGGEMEDA